MTKILEDARRCWDAAIAAVDPGKAVKKTVRHDGEYLHISDFILNIPSDAALKAPTKSLHAVALGKASITMVEAFLEMAGGLVRHTLIIHPANIAWRNHSPNTETIAAGHPLPDFGSLNAGKRLLDLADSLDENDLLALLISGGGSSLACAPADGISLEDKIGTTQALLLAGVDIRALNSVRKHISAIKGGRLAQRAAPAKIIPLYISDVIGDDPSVIASGPVAPDETTYAEALDVCGKADIPKSVINLLERGASGLLPETPKPGNPVFDNIKNVVIASNHHALTGAAREATLLGYKATILTDRLEGEARAVGKQLAAILKSSKENVFIAAGGETTVTVTGAGKGGRNQELALAAAIELEGCDGCLIWSAGTDGIDGTTDAAGAWADGSTVKTARKLGLSPEDFLKRNDSYRFFERVGGLIRTGPTGTNVMDIIFLVKQ